MAQPRELIPRTVYLPPAAIRDAERRAADEMIAMATLLRLILVGKREPLSVAEE